MHNCTQYVFLFIISLSFHLHHGLHLSSGSGPLTGDVAEPETNTALAVLISGQQFRFTYNDAFQYAPGHLKGVVCGNPTSSKCSFDVFIVLAETEIVFQQNYKEVARENRCLNLPPYEISEVAIRSFFADQGANHVEIKILSAGDFYGQVQERNELVEEMGPHATHMTREDWLSAAKKKKDWWRYVPNGNMMLLRHLVHASALAAESTLNKHYTHFLYLREDNAFVEPVHSIWDDIQHMPSQMVMVDEHCPYHAASDKIYLAGREGARVLFSASLEEHAMDISRWVNKAIQGSSLQTETWLLSLMTSSGLDVQHIDFHRVDLRYTNNTGIPCVPRAYFPCTAHPGKFYQKCPC